MAVKKPKKASVTRKKVLVTKNKKSVVSKKKKKQLWIDQGLNILNQLQEPAQQ